MSLPEKNSQAISLADASKLTASFRQSAAKGSVIAGGFWKEGIQGILDQPGCVAVRFYFAKKGDGSSSLVLVGVDSKGNDLTAGPMIDDFFPCPPFCGVTNPLNS